MSSSSTITKAWGVTSATTPFELLDIPRRVPGPKDVKIDVEYCGICHSDIHFVHNDLGYTQYNCVPGHEIVGTVVEVGSEVSKFKVGDAVGVGCLVDTCRKCTHCEASEEQFCPSCIFTFNGPDSHLGGHTYGGYSESITVDEHFVLRIPEGLDKAAAAPLLCAGITTYSPLVLHGVKKGTKVGVVGLGGLGHMAIKLAAAMGAEVTIITTSASKVADAERLGATKSILSTDAEAMKAAVGTFNVIIDTVSAKHSIKDLVGLLAVKGQLVLLGVSVEGFELHAVDLLMHRKNVSGSPIGSIQETQDLLDFCAKHNIVSSIELIGVKDVDNAYKRILKSDVKYRFVIDMKTLKEYQA